MSPSRRAVESGLSALPHSAARQGGTLWISAGYLQTVSAKYASGQATEHSYRAALETLFQSIDPGIEVINEP